VSSPVPSLIEIALAMWLALMYSSACIISGGATLLAGSSVISLSAGVAAGLDRGRQQAIKYDVVFGAEERGGHAYEVR
jgi:hypothetical protein